jgi:DNA-binding XRE family transcriptional regulator
MPAKLAPEIETKRMELYRQGLSDTAIAQKLGCSMKAIYFWRKDRRLPNLCYKVVPKSATPPGQARLGVIRDSLADVVKPGRVVQIIEGEQARQARVTRLHESGFAVRYKHYGGYVEWKDILIEAVKVKAA